MYKGVYYCSRRAGKEMVTQKSGNIINISSIAGIIPGRLAVYAPIKSAVIMLTKILAREWAHLGIRVNSIAPGWVLTPQDKENFEKGLRDPKKILDFIPMHTFVQPEDIAQVALFLASDAARYITGVTIPVDAGVSTEGTWSAMK